MDAIIKIMAFVGFVVILIYLIYKLWGYIDYRAKKTRDSLIRPPLDYMNTIGIKCPDYWAYTGTDDNGNYKCVNTYNIPLKGTPSQCYTDQANTTVVFGALTDDWQDMSIDDRKDFIKKNKPSNVTTTSGYNDTRCNFSKNCVNVWSGVQNQC